MIDFDDLKAPISGDQTQSSVGHSSVPRTWIAFPRKRREPEGNSARFNARYANGPLSLSLSRSRLFRLIISLRASERERESFSRLCAFTLHASACELNDNFAQTQNNTSDYKAGREEEEGEEEENEEKAFHSAAAASRVTSRLRNARGIVSARGSLSLSRDDRTRKSSTHGVSLSMPNIAATAR